MKLALMEITPAEEARMWSYLPNHPLQSILHNELVKRINEDREKLETCGADALSDLQSNIRVRKTLLVFLHQKDPKA